MYTLVIKEMWKEEPVETPLGEVTEQEAVVMYIKTQIAMAFNGYGFVKLLKDCETVKETQFNKAFNVRWSDKDKWGTDMTGPSAEVVLTIHRNFYSGTVSEESYQGRIAMEHEYHTAFYCSACQFASCKYSTKR